MYGANFNKNTFIGLDGPYGTSIQPNAITLVSPTALVFIVPQLSIGTHTLAVSEKAGPWDLSSPVSLNVVSTEKPVADTSKPLPADIDPQGDAGACLDLRNNLRYRSRDAGTNDEVSALQDFLQANGYLKSEPTGYFGLLTLRAVKNFQLASGISSTGFVGPLTRERARVLSGQ